MSATEASATVRRPAASEARRAVIALAMGAVLGLLLAASSKRDPA